MSDQSASLAESEDEQEFDDEFERGDENCASSDSSKNTNLHVRKLESNVQEDEESKEPIILFN